MKTHICEEIATCQCSIIALEPNENCPVHGFGYPGTPKCDTCGRFFKQDD